MGEYRAFTVATGANTTGLTDGVGSGAIPLRLNRPLRTINVNIGPASSGPVYVFLWHGWLITQPNITAGPILCSGWIRSGTIANDDGLYWNGYEPMEPNTNNYLIVIIRNDSGSTVTVNVNWSVDK